jgi:hypothetical protein
VTEEPVEESEPSESDGGEPDTTAREQGRTEPGESQPATDDTSQSAVDPFAIRERYLLPVQNRALRAVKRNLVEVQNQALEDLRLVHGWEPDASIFGDEVGEALTDLARESMVAGFAAAAEMMGAAETPQPADVQPGDSSTEFIAALIEAVQASVTRSRESGAGHRETASSLSRIFRAWRTDDAERRVQHASRTAYHVGVVAALRDLGATSLMVVPSGRPCAECAAGAGAWPANEGPPAGTVLPPARLECACTIVPSS